MITRTIPVFLGVLLLTACATTTEKPRPTSRIDVQQDVGFTITEASPVPDGERLDYSQAIAQLEGGDHARGIALLTRVAEAAPDAAGPRIDLGIAENEAGNLEAAEEHLRRALELNPDHPVTYNELGIVYRKTGRFQEARSAYEKALSIFPGYHPARRNLGVLCDLYLGDLDCALDAYNAYMATVPADPEVAMWIADTRNRLGIQE
jgi:Flp pilus assembly protein TadD